MIFHLLAWMLERMTQEHRRASVGPTFEDQWNASLGAMSAFLGSISFLFGLVALFGVTDRSTWNEMGPGSVPVLAGIAFALAILGGRCGRRAPTVTTRSLGLAKFGAVISSMSSLISAIALALSMLRLAQW